MLKMKQNLVDILFEQNTMFVYVNSSHRNLVRHLLRVHPLLELQARRFQAFLMGTHTRVGAASSIRWLPRDVIHYIHQIYVSTGE